MGFARDAQWLHTGYARFSTEPGRIPHGFNSTASERELLLCILEALFVKMGDTWRVNPVGVKSTGEALVPYILME